MFHLRDPDNHRFFVALSVVLLLVVAAILWWAQADEGQDAPVIIIKQLTIAMLLLLVLGFVLWLMKSLFEQAPSMNERELLMMSTENEPVKTAAETVAHESMKLNESIDAVVDTQAELDQLRAVIAEEPEKVARIVKRWIESSDE